jgi:hypothetical protein
MALPPIETLKPQTIERFWSKIDKHAPVPDHAPELGPCWLWTAYCDKYGYGRLGGSIDGKDWTGLAHVLAYELLVGPVPEGLELDHLCRVPPCCNPAHLEAVPHAVNLARGTVHGIFAEANAARRAATHCKRDHEFTPENTRINGQGHRECRTCKRDRMRRVRAGQ